MAHYSNSKQNLLDMFLDRTAGESTSHNRLITRETTDGNVALIAYGWLKLAEYNERRGVVTVFTGHENLRSRAVSRYLSDVMRRAESRGRDIVANGESPSVDTPNDGTRFIGNYVSFSAGKSSVELDAMKSVRESLRNVA